MMLPLTIKETGILILFILAIEFIHNCFNCFVNHINWAALTRLPNQKVILKC